MNQDLETAAVAALCQAADVVTQLGIAHARQDNPHRFHTVHQEFDGGQAARSLVIEYGAAGELRISQRLTGTADGQEKVVDLFTTVVQGPVDQLLN